MTVKRIYPRRGTAAAWTSVNPILATGELGYETDTGRYKIGNGATAWTSLPYRDAETIVANTAGLASLVESAVDDYVITELDIVATDTHAAASKATPVDADELPLVDSAASYVLKKLTWANLKTTVGSWYDSATRTLTNKAISGSSNTLTNISADSVVDGSTNKAFTGTERTKLSGIETGADVTDAANVASTVNAVSSKATPVDADELPLVDSAASNSLKKLTWANLKTTAGPELIDQFDIVQGDDARLNQVANALHVAWAVVDSEDRIALSITDAGEVVASKINARNIAIEGDEGEVNQNVVPALSDVAWAVVDSDDRMPLSITAAGEVVIPRLNAPNITDVTNAAAVEALTSGPNIVCVGDSLTHGDGGGGTRYPVVLQSLVGGSITVASRGVGGETSPTIAARWSAVPMMVTPVGGSIPAAATPVALTVEQNYGWDIEPLVRGTVTNWATVTVAGVAGAITLDTGTYYFTRATAGDAVSVNEPQPVINLYARQNARDIHIIWVGQNNRSAGAAGLERARVDAAAIIREMDAADKRFLVLNLVGTVGGTPAYDADADDEAWFKLYGRRFLSPRRMMMDYGLAEMGITPTSQDIADIAAGYVPNSLRSDTTHFNADGYTAIARFIYRRLKEFGWV